MLELEPNESLDAATSRILEALEPQIALVKNPPPGEINQTVWIRAQSEDAAQKLDAHLETVARVTSEANDADGWAEHLAGQHRINITSNWPSGMDDRCIVEVTVARVPLL